MIGRGESDTEDRKIPPKRKSSEGYEKLKKRKGIKATCEIEIDHDSAGNIKSDDEKPAQPEMNREWRFQVSCNRQMSPQSVRVLLKITDDLTLSWATTKDRERKTENDG